MRGWAVDLGTTNTGVACWDEEVSCPKLPLLPAICRNPVDDDPLRAPRMVPSVIELIDHPRLLARLGAWPFVERRMSLGQRALIGRPALERNAGLTRSSYVAGFKRALEREALRPIARTVSGPVTAREIAFLFTRELIAEVRRVTGVRLRDLVFTTPIESYETYRAELADIARRLGVRRLRFIDEPVAAALGYGLGLTAPKCVLVVDMGGGTIHMALVRLSPASIEAGRAQVLAKEGRPLGGNVVDGWVLAHCCRALGYDIPASVEDEDAIFWRRLMLAEACRVKEAVYFDEKAMFWMMPPGHFLAIDRRAPGGVPGLPVSRTDLSDILRRNGFHVALEDAFDRLWSRQETHGMSPADVEDVLMVGGSTLLPGIYPFFEERFPRQRIRAWQPFEAVAYGAAVHAAERYTPSDYIVHDYALVTHDRVTNAPQYNIIVPRGTRFPTRPDFWKRTVTPTCSLGNPETFFKLVVCEMGLDAGTERRFVWDAAGQVHALGGSHVGRSAAGDAPSGIAVAEPETAPSHAVQPIVIPLNESNPTLGHLQPAHQPGDRRPRLEIAFGINGERWLCATVRDLLTGKELMHDTPVVRLL